MLARALLGDTSAAPAVRPVIFRNSRLDFSDSRMVLRGAPRVERPGAASHENEEKQRAEHHKISARVAHHVPESLIRTKQLRNFRRRNCCGYHDQRWHGGCLGPKSHEYQKAAHDFKRADEMRGEVRM